MLWFRLHGLPNERIEEYESYFPVSTDTDSVTRVIIGATDGKQIATVG